jgi:hypothetical protein
MDGTDMIRYGFLCLFVLALLAGCVNKAEDEQTGRTTDHIETDADDPSGTNKEDQNEDNPVNETKAMQDAQMFIEAIKEKNEEKFIQLFDDSQQLGADAAKKVIEGFASNFDLSTLTVQINYDGLAMGPDWGQYEFVLKDQNTNEFNEENRLVIRYEEDGSKVYDNPYVRYFPYAEAMVTRYLDLVKNEKADELADFLNADDIDVPIWVAEEAIKNYNDYSDGNNLSLRYSRRFQFVVDNAAGKEHVIEIIYGDGLMGIKDDFIPDF